MKQKFTTRQIIDFDSLPSDGCQIVCMPSRVACIVRYFLSTRALWSATYKVGEFLPNGDYERPSAEQMEGLENEIAGVLQCL